MTAPDATGARAAVAPKRQWPRRRKFRIGRQVETLMDAVQLIAGGYWLYHWHKPMHPAMMRNWSLAMLQGAVDGRRLHLALDARETANLPAIARAKFLGDEE